MPNAEGDLVPVTTDRVSSVGQKLSIQACALSDDTVCPNMLVEHDMSTTTHTTQPAQRNQKGWRSAPDAILPGHRRHPSGSPQGHPRCHVKKNVDEKFTDDEAEKNDRGD